MRYDEWKGFEYTTDREFDLRTFWAIAMYDHSNPESHDLFRDPEHIEDAVLTIVDAKSEPVGGEMKLRSGGFVDITIELYWSGTMNGIESISAYETYYKNPFYVKWTENAAYPCDAYTGTSLLNYVSSNGDPDEESISPGQAQASSMAESDITWKGRTYQIPLHLSGCSGDNAYIPCPGRLRRPGPRHRQRHHRRAGPLPHRKRRFYQFLRSLCGHSDKE